LTGTSPKRRLCRSLLVLCVAAFLASCADKPTPSAPSTTEAQPQMAAAKKGGDDSPLLIEDMLGDALFQVSVESVVIPAVRDPLLAAVEALETGRTNRSIKLIIEAQAEADELLDDPDADLESLISWTVLERYFEEAELI
jgi:hypothetical protein